MRARGSYFHASQGGVAKTGSALTDSEQQLGVGLLEGRAPGLWSQTCNPGWR